MRVAPTECAARTPHTTGLIVYGMTTSGEISDNAPRSDRYVRTSLTGLSPARCMSTARTSAPRAASIVEDSASISGAMQTTLCPRSIIALMRLPRKLTSDGAYEPMIATVFDMAFRQQAAVVGNDTRIRSAGDGDVRRNMRCL